MPKENEGFPFSFDVGKIHVEGTILRMKLWQQLTLRNDFATYYFEQDRGRFGSEPNVARAINKVLAACVEEIEVGGHKYPVDDATPLRHMPDLPDAEYQAKFTDMLIRECVRVNPNLGTEDPFRSLFAQYHRMILQESGREELPEADPTRQPVGTGTTKESNT